MRPQYILLCLISIPLGAQVSRVAFSEGKDTVPAFNAAGTISVPAARVKVDIAYPRGRKERADLTVVYDAGTGYYLWNVVKAKLDTADDGGSRLNMMKAQKAAIFVDTAGLVQFDLGDGLFVKNWSERADSLDSAVTAASNGISRNLATYEEIGFHRDYKFVPVFGSLLGFESKIPPGFKPIARDFRCAPFTAFCPSNENTIVSVGKDGSTWRVLLRNRFDVEVVLDQNFDLISAKQLTQPRK